MPLAVDETPTGGFPTPSYLTLGSFKRGVISLLDRSRLPKDALEQADNLFLVEDGQPSRRPGVDWFGTAAISTVTTSYTVPTAATGTNWTNPTNVYASDDSRAVYANTTQNDLKITGFNMEVPDDAIILGVEVSVEGNGTDATAANRSIEIGMTKDGSTLAGSRLASQNLNQTTDTTLTFGTAANLFSTTLTADEVQASTWGILLRAGNTNAGARNIDQVKVRVTYTPVGTVDGFDYFDSSGAIHLVEAVAGLIYRSTNDGATWTLCTGAVLTPGVAVSMNQSGGFLYITNGANNIVRYDGTTTLQTYAALSTPAAPTIVETGSGLTSGTSYQYYYKCSRVNTVGFSVASAASTVIQTGLPRESWDATTNFATLTLPALSGTQTRYDVFVSTDNLDYFYLGSTATTTFVDDGSWVVSPNTLAPTGNTTQGPLVEELVNVGSRMYGVRDTANPARIWFTGAGNYAGAFSSAYDGGYLDWQEGGKYTPVKVEDYRDGKGTPLATVWCKSADGQGCILQMSLDTLTIGDISITVPSAYKLPGSRGTPAPGSVVNVLNDYMFYNSQAFYNLGSRAQFLNLLSTDESSANIRPTIKQISVDGETQISSVYFDAKVYFSVPYGSATNNNTIVYDTERKAWLPKAFTLGFKKFLRYTDTTGARKLLAVKSGDDRLSEISESINGDYGEAFTTTLVTGLYPITKNRFEFQFTEEGEIELSNPQGRIFVELQGYERSSGFTSIRQRVIDVSYQLSNTGHSTFAHSTTLHSDTSAAVEVFSESSVKRYFTVQKETNALQWRITTTGVDSHYVLRTLQTWGTATESGKPREWRLTS